MTEIDIFLERMVNKGKTPSVQYILFDKDRIIKKCSIGLADISGNKKVDQRTTYNAFSITKTFTAIAIMQLAEQNKLNIEQPVKRYLPGFPYSADITTRQLLSHLAGIPNPIPLNWIHLTTEHTLFNRDEFFKNIFSKNNKAKAKPGEKFAYSNLGFILLGQLIEKVSATSYEQYINDNIIQKLGVEHTGLGFEIPDIHFHAKGYHKKLSITNFILGMFIDKSKFMGKAEGKWKPFCNFYVNGTSYGGLIGTPDAFRKYIQDLLKENSLLLQDNSKKLLFTESYAANNKPTGMCLSWFRGDLNGNRYFAHAGGGGGYYCEIRIYPGKGIGSVIFFNRTGMSDERCLDKVDQFYFNHYR